MIEVSVKGANAVCTNPLPLTTGMNGVKVKFNFSPGWDNLTPLAVFTNGRTTLDAIITDDIATIPHEVLALKNRMVLVGIFGVDSSNNIIIPTIYAELGYVSLGADPTGDESAVTSPALYEQAIEKAENALGISREAAEDATTALEYATEVKQKSDAGELDGFSPSASVTKDGNKSTITITDKDGTTTAEVTDGRTPVKGTDYFTSDDIAAVRAGLENSVNKTTVLSSASTDSQYPSAKAVRDYVLSQTSRYANKMDQPNNDGTPGQVLKLTEDGTEWADESGGQSIDASLLDTAVTKSSVATWENGVAKIGDGTITVTVIDAAGKRKVVVDHDDNPDEYCDTTYVREDFSAARVPGKKVSHWTCDGEIISVNNPDLSLSIVVDCTVEAHYIDESEENTLGETGHTYCFLRPRYRQSNNTKYCLASNGAMVPAGATSAVYGCMRTFDQGYSTEDTLILENVGTLIAKTSTSIADGVTRKYGLTRISLPSEVALENIWVRPYTTYTLNGATHTVYGPIKHISWNETMPDVVTEIEINGHKATIGGGGGASTDQDITMTDYPGTLRDAFQYAGGALTELQSNVEAIVQGAASEIEFVNGRIDNLGDSIDELYGRDQWKTLANFTTTEDLNLISVNFGGVTTFKELVVVLYGRWAEGMSGYLDFALRQWSTVTDKQFRLYETNRFFNNNDRICFCHAHILPDCKVIRYSGTECSKSLGRVLDSVAQVQTGYGYPPTGVTSLSWYNSLVIYPLDGNNMFKAGCTVEVYYR